MAFTMFNATVKKAMQNVRYKIICLKKKKSGFQVQVFRKHRRRKKVSVANQSGVNFPNFKRQY